MGLVFGHIISLPIRHIRIAVTRSEPHLDKVSSDRSPGWGGNPAVVGGGELNNVCGYLNVLGNGARGRKALITAF
jgi:hypothetical protein